LRTHTLMLASAAIIALAAAPAFAQTDRWQVGTASSVLTGRYGTDTPTTVVYTPTTARRLFADGDVTLVFPLTCVKGDGGVTVISGSPVRTERGAATGSSETPPRAGNSGGRGASTVAAPVTTCGMGDVVARGRYYVLDEHGWIPTIAFRAHLKMPTASVARGLGTGRPDEGIGVEVSRAFAGGSVVMADGGYTFVGKPSGISYQNTWWYDVGVAQDIAGGIVNLSVFFEEYRAILPGFPNARDVLASVLVKSATGWRLQISGQFGVSDGAPDHGLTLGASRRF